MASARPSRSDRARGLRTLQHQTLPASIRYGIDTEVWYRGLVAERDGKRDARWATKDQVHDEAIAWFLERHRRKPFVFAAASRREDADDLTFWVDSKLMERARRMAVRDGVRLARLIETAFGCYVEQYVSARLIAFRRWIQLKACTLYRSNRASARTRPRSARARGKPAAPAGRDRR